MTASRSILAWGSYLPRWRMARQTIAAQTAWLEPALAKRARGQRTVANWDEDAITMAVAAADRALDPTLLCDSLTFATTTAPFTDRSNAGLVGDALSLASEVSRADATGSQRAGTSALLSTLAPDRNGMALVTAADRRCARVASAAELHQGDGAAAFLVGSGEGAARCLGVHAVHADFVHQYRTVERDVDYVLEDRWVRDAGILTVVPQTLLALVSKCNVPLARIRHLILPFANRHGRHVCKALSLDSDILASDLFATVGDTGVAHALLQLAHVLETAAAGDIVALVGFGQGCDAALFEVTENAASVRGGPTVAAAANDGARLDDYLKLPAFSRQLCLDRGLRAEADKRTALSVHARRAGEINSMIGSRCRECQTPHFPSARICVACGATDRMSDYPFARRQGRLKTFTEDWQAFSPSPPLCYGNVSFEGGGNAFMALTDIEPGDAHIDMPLMMQFRIKDFDDRRGFRRYFFKGVPLRETDHG
ncbi:MAG: 3-hydroxy-3-methylglutaryl CoA synthase [Gammaproteobacteria bacterium]